MTIPRGEGGEYHPHPKINPTGPNSKCDQTVTTCIIMYVNFHLHYTICCTHTHTHTLTHTHTHSHTHRPFVQPLVAVWSFHHGCLSLQGALETAAAVTLLALSWPTQVHVRCVYEYAHVHVYMHVHVGD